MVKRHFKIGIDLDDVLIGTADKTTLLYNAAYNTKLTRDDWYRLDPVTPWDAETLSEITKRVIQLLGSSQFNDVDVIKDAQSVLNQLKIDGHKLYVITGRPESLRPQTLAILNKYYPAIFSNDTLYFTDHFDHDGQKATKVSIAKQLGLTHFIDDQIEHANMVAAADVKTIIFSDNYLWNQKEADKGVTRLTSWRAIENFFNDEQRNT